MDACRETLEEAQAGHFIIVTSALTLCEVLWTRGGPKLGEDKARILNKFFRRSCFRVVNVDRPIAEASQKLVWEQSIRPKDAVHVATALHHGCGILETFDSGLIGNGAAVNILIREPQGARQSSLELRPIP